MLATIGMPNFARDDLLKALRSGLNVDAGLHEFLSDFLRRNAALSQQIEKDYRFTE